MVMKNKNCIVTGANSGLGRVTATELAKMGAAVTIVCRDEERGRTALNEIRSLSGINSVELLIADMSSQSSIRSLANEIVTKFDRLDVLVNNAGTIFGSRHLSEDGIEMTFALNHLGYFQLTLLLLDLLKKSNPARIVNVASGAHYSGSIDFEDIQLDAEYSGWKAYSQSKLANVLFTYELSRRLDGTGVTVNCLHPGVVRTGFGKSETLPFRLLFLLIKPFLISDRKGADTQIYLASSPNVADVSGIYFDKRKEKRSSEESYREGVAKKLWELSLELTGILDPT